MPLRLSVALRRTLIPLAALALLAACGTDPDPGDNQTEADAGHDADPGDDECRDFAEVEDLTLESSCYIVDRIYSITDGHLHVPAGTTFHFAHEAGLDVGADGSLAADGTEEDPVQFVGLEQESGFWMGLRFRSPSGNNRLEHAVVEHAGADRWHSTADVTRGGVVFQGSARLNVTDSVFRHNLGAAISAEETGRPFGVSASHFEDNEVPFRISAANIAGLASDLTFEDNDADVVRVVRGAITDDAVWRGLEVPYQIQSTVGISNSANLTIEAGASFEFELHTGLTFDDGATISIEGTEQAPVEMRGTEELAGHWRGIAIRNSVSTTNSIEYLVLEDAGSERWHSTAELSEGGLVARNSDVRLEVANSTFRNNRFAGISLPGATADVAVAGSTFEDNDHPLQIRTNHLADIAGDNEFVGDDPVLVVGDANMTRDGTWSALETTVEFTDRPWIEADLTIEPGARLQFRNHAGLEINEGTISAIGEADDPIVFAGAEQLQGFWRGLRLRHTQTTANELNHVEIHHAGSERWHSTRTGSDAGIVVENSSLLELNNAEFTESGGYAVGIHSGSEVTGCDNVTFDSIAESEPVFGADLSCF